MPRRLLCLALLPLAACEPLAPAVTAAEAGARDIPALEAEEGAACAARVGADCAQTRPLEWAPVEATPCGDGELSVDTDGDGVEDCYDGDIDGDGVNNVYEILGYYGFVTDPEDPDTDGDGAWDGEDAAPLHDFCSDNLYLYEDFEEDGGMLEIDADDFEDIIWLGDETLDDFTVEVGMRLDAHYVGGSAGLTLRAEDHERFGRSGYDLSVSPARVSLERIERGRRILGAGDVPTRTRTPVRVRAEIDGDRLTVSTDGQHTFTAYDGAFADGAQGLRARRAAASFDYVIACD